MKRLSLLFLTMLSLTGLYGLDVDRSELEIDPSLQIQFENYEGPPAKIETADQIRGIGGVLGRLPASGEGSYFDRYRVIRVLDREDSPGLNADIFILEKEAAVDHIRNLRLIIAGYLTAAFGYSAENSRTLAEFITVYNAVYRKNLDYFSRRYNPPVLSHLSLHNAGLARSYREWPGATRMLIPLSQRGAPGVETGTISDREVISELRTREDRAVELRKEMVEIKEEHLAREEERVEEARETLKEKSLSLAEEEKELERALQEVAEKKEVLSRDQDSPEAERERKELEEKGEDLERRRIALEQDREEQARQEEEVREDETKTAQAREELRRERRDIAVDQQEILSRRPDEVAAGLPFIIYQGGSGGKLLMIHPRTGQVLPDSPEIELSRRSFRRFGGGLAVILSRSGSGRLAILDSAGLGEKALAREEVYPQSILETGAGGIFAVIRDGESWRLGKYDSALSLTAVSSLEVNPETFLLVTDGALFVEDRAGRVRPLSPGSLE